MPWDPFLMKVLLKKKVCGSHEQFTSPTGKSKCTSQKKKKKKANADEDADKLYPNG